MAPRSMGARDLEAPLPPSTSAGPGLHRRSDLQRAGSGSEQRRRHQPGSPSARGGGRMTRARGVLADSRWQLLGLLVAGLLLHSMTAKHTQPWLAATSSSLGGGVAIRGLPLANGEGGAAGEASSRSRALVEQHEPGSGGGSSGGTLAALTAAAAGLVAARRGAPPPAPIPKAWLEGGTLGQWPKPYRNKTRQVVPNSVYQWRCTPDAANFTLAAATHNPLLQSTEWRQKYGDEVSMYKWCREGLPEEVPQLQPVLKLQSAKPRPERGLTVVTQLSLERFQMLDNQCSTWPLQISAVLYIPLLKGRIFSAEEPSWNKKSLDVGIAEALKFFEAVEASPSSCILDLEVVVEERCDRYSAMLYPANAARNRALVNAATDAVLLVDVDFAVSRSLADLVQGQASYQRLLGMLHGRNALVLPAFETQDDGEAGRQVALEAVRRGKPYVVRKFEWNVVFGFHVPQYPQGHQATDYWRWIKSHGAYPVQYQIGYEPYILMHRDYVPFYDERFRGYYWNKVQHLMHISLQNGFSFLVHPTAFVVHVPHKKPSTKWLTRKMGQKEKNHLLFDNALFHMRQMDFVPVTSWPDKCTPGAAPVLPGEGEAREVAAMKAAAERAAAEAAELALRQNVGAAEAAAAAAAKRATEAAEAEAWMRQNAELAKAAGKQRQDATLQADESFRQHQAQLAAAAAAAAAGEAATAAGEQSQAVAAAMQAAQAAAGAAEAAAAAAQQQQAAAAAAAQQQQAQVAAAAAQQQAVAAAAGLQQAGEQGQQEQAAGTSQAAAQEPQQAAAAQEQQQAAAAAAQAGQQAATAQQAQPAQLVQPAADDPKTVPAHVEQALPAAQQAAEGQGAAAAQAAAAAGQAAAVSELASPRDEQAVAAAAARAAEAARQQREVAEGAGVEAAEEEAAAMDGGDADDEAEAEEQDFPDEGEEEVDDGGEDAPHDGDSAGAAAAEERRRR